MHKIKALIFAFAMALMTVVPVAAVNPDEVLKDPEQEARARALSAQIRCLVCQNQSIDDSDARLARDLRLLVREQIVEGKEDQEILGFLVERYGEFVLLKPPVSIRTIALWGTPFVLLLIGAGTLLVVSRRVKPLTSQSQSLDADEEAAISEILKRNQD